MCIYIYISPIELKKYAPEADSQKQIFRELSLEGFRVKYSETTMSATYDHHASSLQVDGVALGVDPIIQMIKKSSAPVRAG